MPSVQPTVTWGGSKIRRAGHRRTFLAPAWSLLMTRGAGRAGGGIVCRLPRLTVIGFIAAGSNRRSRFGQPPPAWAVLFVEWCRLFVPPRAMEPTSVVICREPGRARTHPVNPPSPRSRTCRSLRCSSPPCIAELCNSLSTRSSGLICPGRQINRRGAVSWQRVRAACCGAN